MQTSHFDTLTKLLDHFLTCAKILPNDRAMVSLFFGEAYGTVTMYEWIMATEKPSCESAAKTLWEEVYKPEFEELLKKSAES